MRKHISIAAILLMLNLMLVQDTLAKTYNGGADMSKLVPISTLLSDPKKYAKSLVTIEGTITGVCRKRGCWMTLASDKKFETLRVKVKDGEMVFPMSAQGKTAYATGELKAITLSLKQTNSRREQRGLPSTTEPETIYQFSPSSVTIQN